MLSCWSLVSVEGIKKVRQGDIGKEGRRGTVWLYILKIILSLLTTNEQHFIKLCIPWKWLQQWTGQRQLSLKRKKNPQKNTLAVTFDPFCFCFCRFLVFFHYMEAVPTVSSSLCSVQEPSEALMESEQIPGIVAPSRGSRSCIVSPVTGLLTFSKPVLHQESTIVLLVTLWEMSAKVMMDLFVELQKDDLGRQRCSCVSLVKGEDHLD